MHKDCSEKYKIGAEMASGGASMAPTRVERESLPKTFSFLRKKFFDLRGVLEAKIAT